MNRRIFITGTILAGSAARSSAAIEDWQFVNALADGSDNKPLILVYTNRYGYKRRTPFGSQAAAQAFANDSKNNVVKPRLYRVEEVPMGGAK